MKEKQAAMDIITTYPIKEMGHQWGGDRYIIYLYDSFLSKHFPDLNAELFDLLPEEKKLTKIGCPFCGKGVLKCVVICPRYGAGPGQRAPHVLYHTSDDYIFYCSNQECDGKFSGSIRLMHID